MEPVTVVEPELPPLPARPAENATPAQAFPYYAIRTQRSEAAALFFQGERDAERDARVTNAETQRVCAAWARGQDAEQ